MRASSGIAIASDLSVGTNRERQQLLKAIGEHRCDLLLILIAFDGVLANYRDDPGRVVLTRRRRAVLKRLQNTPGVVLAIISGRTLSDLRRRLDLGDDVFYVALHGLEVVGPEFVGVRQGLPSEYFNRMADLARQLKRTVGDVSGTRVEYKDGVVALHTRSASSEDAIWTRFQLLNSAAPMLHNGTVRVLRGLNVLELLPNMGHAKAQAIEAIRDCLASRYHHSVFTVYIGEDAADDDAYEALGGRSVTAVVGRRRQAVHHLNSPSEIEILLKSIAASRSRGRMCDEVALVTSGRTH